MISKRHSGGEDEHGIDLAPMLDFVLNLLIFFIITTSFVREPGVTVSKAPAEMAVPLENANILIALRANGEIWMDRHQVDIREVRPLVERLHIERPEDMVVVVADKSAKSGLLGKVMDQVKAGGIKDVAVGAAGPSGK